MKLSVRATNCLLNALLGINVSDRKSLRRALLRGDLRMKRVKNMGLATWIEMVSKAGLKPDFDKCTLCKQTRPKFWKKDKAPMPPQPKPYL